MMLAVDETKAMARAMRRTSPSKTGHPRPLTRDKNGERDQNRSCIQASNVERSEADKAAGGATPLTTDNVTNERAARD
jgi:hypothetical protein